ncbi:MAG: hypothetical protein K6T29_01760 [Peptococcaceae bacterium]|nr:hypothetical protein [Peptococcaceae bacterium]
MIVHKKQFMIGLAMIITFTAVFVVLMSPIIGGKTVINYADDLFNQLTKGSTYAIPGVQSKAKNFDGKAFEVTLSAKDQGEAEKMTKLFTAAEARVAVEGQKVKVSGDLGKVARAALADADLEFKNNGAQIKGKYGMDSREAVYYWWNLFNVLANKYKQENMAAELSYANNVMQKALEPAYNFEDITPVKVQERAGITTFMLIFYVIYTVWYGFAIMYLFEGLGIIASHGEKAEA